MPKYEVFFHCEHDGKIFFKKTSFTVTASTPEEAIIEVRKAARSRELHINKSHPNKPVGEIIVHGAREVLF